MSKVKNVENVNAVENVIIPANWQLQFALASSAIANCTCNATKAYASSCLQTVISGIAAANANSSINNSFIVKGKGLRLLTHIVTVCKAGTSQQVKK